MRRGTRFTRQAIGRQNPAPRKGRNRKWRSNDASTKRDRKRRLGGDPSGRTRCPAGCSPTSSTTGSLSQLAAQPAAQHAGLSARLRSALLLATRLGVNRTLCRNTLTTSSKKHVHKRDTQLWAEMDWEKRRTRNAQETQSHPRSSRRALPGNSKLEVN